MTPRGKRPRGLCPECGAARRVKADGTMGGHGRLNRSGYTIQRPCPGVDKEPKEMVSDGWQAEPRNAEGQAAQAKQAEQKEEVMGSD